ncbi:hypothetical protein AAC387_Pa10g0806 [Persea americana]
MRKSSTIMAHDPPDPPHPPDPPQPQPLPGALVVPSHPIPQLPLHQPISPNPPSFPPTIVDRRQLADRITRRVIRRGFLGCLRDSKPPSSRISSL